MTGEDLIAERGCLRLTNALMDYIEEKEPLSEAGNYDLVGLSQRANVPIDILRQMLNAEQAKSVGIIYWVRALQYFGDDLIAAEWGTA